VDPKSRRDPRETVPILPYGGHVHLPTSTTYSHPTRAVTNSGGCPSPRSSLLSGRICCVSSARPLMLARNQRPTIIIWQRGIFRALRGKSANPRVFTSVIAHACKHSRYYGVPTLTREGAYWCGVPPVGLAVVLAHFGLRRLDHQGDRFAERGREGTPGSDNRPQTGI